MENSLLFIFGKIWPKSLYYSTGIVLYVQYAYCTVVYVHICTCTYTTVHIKVLFFIIILLFLPPSSGGSRGGGGVGSSRQSRPHSGGQRPPSDSAPPNGVVAKQPLRYDSDFDFDIANALFSKESLEKEIKEKLKITIENPPTGEETVDETSRGAGPGDEVVVVSDRAGQEEEEPVGSYNKEVSFFDNISCEANSSSK